MPTPIIRELQIVGLYFRDADTKNTVRGLASTTQKVKLLPEPDNTHDKHALKVVLDMGDVHIGYVPAAVSPLLLSWLTIPEPFYAYVFLKPDKQLPTILLSIETP